MVVYTPFTAFFCNKASATLATFAFLLAASRRWSCLLLSPFLSLVCSSKHWTCNAFILVWFASTTCPYLAWSPLFIHELKWYDAFRVLSSLAGEWLQVCMEEIQGIFSPFYSARQMAAMYEQSGNGSKDNSAQNCLSGTWENYVALVR